MRNILLAAGFVGLFGLVQACGGDSHPQAINEGGTNQGGSKSPGKAGSAGKENPSEGGAGGDSGEQASNAPVVEITSPTESATPADGVLVEQAIKVVCTVVQSTAPGAAAIDEASVKLSVNDAKGKALDTKNASSTGSANEYSADFVLTTVDSGPLSFTCTASDKNKLEGKDTVATFVDHGPTITVESPVKDAAYPLKGGLNVDFTVAPTPLADDDMGADVASVEFTLDGKIQELQELSPGKFHTTLQLDDTDSFPAKPSGAVTITAKNVREPTPVTATLSYSIVIDGDGPVITIESPKPQAVVGGPVSLVFMINDPGAGVDEKSVNVSLWAGGPPIFFDKENGWSHIGNKYTYTFDSKLIEPHAFVQTTLNVLASDSVGNPSASGQSVQIYLDNVPPKVDLDPANIRIIGPQNTCSGSFDPVGALALNDLQGSQGVPALLNPIGFFRAFVEERTNAQAGQLLFYHAGTDQKEVRLYIQPDPEHATTKLLVNKNPLQDNTCDDIGGVDDLQNAPPFSAMNPPSAGATMGSLWYQSDVGVAPSITNKCGLKVASDPQPERLCASHTSDMWYVPYNTQLKEPLVYVVGTPNGQDASCAGIDLAFLTNAQPDGWVCAAARAVDNAGNVGISPPLRLCAVRDVNNPPACYNSSTVPPTCTDGCIPPVRGGGELLLP